MTYSEIMSSLPSLRGREVRVAVRSGYESPGAVKLSSGEIIMKGTVKSASSFASTARIEVKFNKGSFVIDPEFKAKRTSYTVEVRNDIDALLKIAFTD